jgi:hypothetical protein
VKSAARKMRILLKMSSNTNKKENIIKNSLLFFLLRDSLPYRKEYTFKEFNNDQDNLINKTIKYLESLDLNIDKIIYSKEEKEQIFLDVFLIPALSHRFKEIIKEEYYKYLKSSIPQKQRLYILERDNYICQYCGANLRKSEKKGFPAQVDHIKSKRSGGKDNPENLLSCCWECNMGKSDYDSFEYET